MASKAETEVEKEKTKFSKRPSGENVSAEVEESKSEKTKIQEKDSSEDESIPEDKPHLDIFSPDFDPMAAIYSLDLAISTPSAPIMDNVESFVVKVLVNFTSSLHWIILLSFCSFSYNRVCYDELKLSVSDVIFSLKGSNGDGNLHFFGRDYNYSLAIEYTGLIEGKTI